MKITTKKEQRAELLDGTVVVVEMDEKDRPTRVRAARAGNGPDSGETAAIDLDVPGEWLERICAAVEQMTDTRGADHVCPDHGWWRMDYKRPDDIRYKCPACYPTPKAKPAPLESAIEAELDAEDAANAF
jgi:hypothetical protein